MKSIIHIKQICTIAISTLVLILIPIILAASSNPDYVIISGQVTNIECDIAIENHNVYIKSNAIKEGRSSYFNTVTTNNEGYYYDTVYTNESKGSFEVYTYDFSGESVDTTVHFRLLERGNNIMIANFSIYIPYQAWKLQAKFKYTEVLDDANLNKFRFIDQTENTNIIGWHWDFGDGNTSKLQSPEHVYSSPGLFIVRFTVTAIINNEPKLSTVTKQVYIPELQYYHLGGHVFSEYFPIDMGHAYLYLLDSSDNYIALDTIAFDTLGYYYFYQVPVGQYLIKVEPMQESEYYGMLLPTYYGDKLFWDEAELIHISYTSWEYDINLVYSEGALSGSGNISGNIEYAELPRAHEGLSAAGINIYLMDESDNLLTCKYSDDDGGFTFDFVELNTYWLYPEVTGIPSEKIKVELSPESPSISNVNIIILSSGISYIFPIDELNQEEEVGLPYPNPVSETINLPLNLENNKNISIEIINISGQTVYTDNFGTMTDASILNLSALSFKNGTYILRTKVNDRLYDKIFVVAR